jgi:hypothetical protein
MVEQQFGYTVYEPTERAYGVAGYTLSSSGLEVMALAPPTTRWESSSYMERYRAGLFLHYRRNPISPMTVLRLAPFPTIFSFSEAFDLYMQLSAWRNNMRRGNMSALSHVNSLIDGGEITGLHTNMALAASGKGRDDGALLLMVTKDAANLDVKTFFGKPEDRKVIVGPQPGTNVWELVIRPDSALTAFSQIAKNITSDAVIIPAFPRTVARQLQSFPLFISFMRFIDNLGLYLKDEITIRLRETTYESEESVQLQNIVPVNILS